MINENSVAIEEQGIDLRKWISLFLRYWPFFLTSMGLAFFITFLFISLSTPQYLLSTHILVRNQKNPLDKGQLFSAVFTNDPYQLENEKGVLQAKSVIRSALMKLDFQTGYYIKHKFRKKELYTQTPFTVEKDTTHLQPIGIFYYVNFLNDSILIVKAVGEDVLLYDFSSNRIGKRIPEFRFEDTVKFGQITGNSYCRFSLLPGFEYLSDENVHKTYYFRFYSLDEQISIFRNYKTENDRASSILTVSLKYMNVQKAADFLNSLTSEYLKKGIERDNNVAEATIRFIDAQLTDIVDSLHQSGERLQGFKSSNKVLDLSYQAEKVYSKIENLETEKARLLVKKRYFNYLLENLKSKSDVSDLIAPTTLEINDPVLNNLVLQLADLYGERSELSFNSIKNNPYITSLELKINDTRQKLIEAARNVLDATAIAFEEIVTQITGAEQALNRLPKEQQQYLNYERKFKLNDELYTYLLTRRSEMEIFKASNIPVNEVLDKADASDAVVVSPNKRTSIIIAFMLGLFFPGALLYFRETINNKIRNREDIQKVTGLPLVGQVIDSKTSAIQIVLSEPNSVLRESFRTLRTNLQFVIDESVSNTILITSAIKGEGKSFTALNLASVYSFYDKKTILVDFDLRKSDIKERLGIEANRGLSNFLSKNATYKELIFSDKKLNFDLILAGPLPPNPSELIASPLTVDLFKKLKRDYEIIIIDSPPLGIVSDALLVYPFTDITLLVVRYNYTSFEVLESVIDDIKTRKVERVNIVLNDIEPRKGKYGYGYGYGYGYVEKEKSGA
jgi:capsular exopolysaccharide synthesis family protein